MILLTLPYLLVDSNRSSNQGSSIPIPSPALSDLKISRYFPLPTDLPEPANLFFYFPVKKVGRDTKSGYGSDSGSGSGTKVFLDYDNSYLSTSSITEPTCKYPWTRCICARAFDLDAEISLSDRQSRARARARGIIVSPSLRTSTQHQPVVLFTYSFCY